LCSTLKALPKASYEFLATRCDHHSRPADAKFSSSFLVSVFARPPYVQHKLAVTTVLNFYRYLLHHDVACHVQEPNIIKDIYRALDVCKAAEKELPLVVEAQTRLPGPFHDALALLTLKHREDDVWANANDHAWNQNVSNGEFFIDGFSIEGTRMEAPPRPSESQLQAAKNDFLDREYRKAHALAAAAIVTKLTLDPDMDHHINNTALHSLWSEPRGWHACTIVRQRKKNYCLKVVSVMDSSLEMRVPSLSEYLGVDSPEFEKLVKVTFVESPIHKLESVDVPDGWRAPPEQFGTTEVWLEKSIAGLFTEGMKLVVDLNEIQIGPPPCNRSDCAASPLAAHLPPATEGLVFWHIEAVKHVFCSFHTFLPNELVIKPWKKLKFKPYKDAEPIAQPDSENAADDSGVDLANDASSNRGLESK
jgi:hypothetical protein